MFRLVCAALVLLGLGCGDDGGGATLDRLSIEAVAPLPKGTFHQLRAFAHRSDGTQDDVTPDVIWETSDMAILTITADGDVRGIALGAATVSATMDGVTGTLDIEVTDPVLVSLEVSPGSATLSTAEPLQLAAVGTYSDDSTRELTDVVAWTSSNPGIVVSATGLASATAAATATITATELGSTISDTATLTAELATTIELSITGGGTGSVRVENATTLATIATCTASCSIAVDDGTMVNLVASTPATYGGFSGACASTTATCVFTPASSTAEVSVTFSLDPGADWERLLYPDETVFAADFDSAGNLIVGTTSHLAKLDTTGATIWEQLRPVRQVRVGPADTIYVIAGTDLVKLDASGGEIWTRPLDTVAAQPTQQQFVQRMDVGADGVVAVHGDGTLRTWGSDGTPGWSVATESYDFWGVAIDAAGNVWSATEDENTLESTTAQGYTAAGVPIAQQVTFTGQYHGMLVVDGSDHLIAATSGHSDVWLDRRSTANVSTFTLDEVIADPDYVPNGVAVAGDELFWVYELDDASSASGFRARGVGLTGTVDAMFTRTPMSADVGVKVYDVAGHTSGRRAVVGEYWTSPNLATLERTGWIQTYLAP